MKTRQETKQTPEPKRIPKPGDPCPNCGKTLQEAKAAAAWCPACKSVFGRTPLKPPPWGKAEDAHLAAIEKWLAEPRTDAEIEWLLVPDNLSNYYRTFTYAPAAWKRGTAILRAELKRRQMEHDEKRPVQRIGAEVKFMPTKPKGSKSLSAKRAKAGRKKRKVKNEGDRHKIKTAFRQYRKTHDSDNWAAKEIARLAAWEKAGSNCLELNENYPDLNADDVKRIAGVKK